MAMTRKKAIAALESRSHPPVATLAERDAHAYALRVLRAIEELTPGQRDFLARHADHEVEGWPYMPDNADAHRKLSKLLRMR